MGREGGRVGRERWSKNKATAVHVAINTNKWFSCNISITLVQNTVCVYIYNIKKHKLFSNQWWKEVINITTSLLITWTCLASRLTRIKADWLPMGLELFYIYISSMKNNFIHVQWQTCKCFPTVIPIINVINLLWYVW